MSILERIANRLILSPSSNPIDAEGKSRLVVQSGTHQIDVWTENTGVETNDPNNRLLAIKFPGAAGRAERSTLHPFHIWRHANVEVWTVNHRGYGNSTPPASLRSFANTISAVWERARAEYPERRIVAYGNSLGSISALHLAARYPVAGVYLRNPVPLKQLISMRPKYSWPSLGTSRFVGNVVPIELDSIDNAGSTACPILFIKSEKDRVIPGPFQDLIWNSITSSKRRFIIRDADHHHRITEAQESEYVESLQWLFSELHKPFW